MSLDYKKDLNKPRSTTYSENRQIPLTWIRMFHPEFNVPLEVFSAKSEFDTDTTADNHNYVPNCPFDIQKQMLHFPLPEKPAETTRKTPKEKYPELFEEATNGVVRNKTLKAWYNQRLEARQIICGVTEDGNYFYRPCMVKGDHIYNQLMKSRVMTHADMLEKNYKFHYFLTLTYDVKTYGEDLIKSWQKFSIHVDLTLKMLRKKLLFGYVAVFEATNKGRPHAHILLASNDEEYQPPEAVKAGNEIKGGTLYAMLANQVHSPVFCLQKAKAENLQGYLAKYMSKSSLESEKELTKTDNRMTGADRKALLSIAMPVIAGVRQIRCSIRDNPPPPEVPLTQKELLSRILRKPPEDSPQPEISPAPPPNPLAPPPEGSILARMAEDIRCGFRHMANDEDLIYILNKLPCCARSQYFLISDKQAKKQLRTQLSLYNKEKPPDMEDMLIGSRALQCPGCFIRDILYKLQNTHALIPTNIPPATKAENCKTPIEEKLLNNFALSSTFCLDKGIQSEYNDYMNAPHLLLSKNIIRFFSFAVPPDTVYSVSLNKVFQAEMKGTLLLDSLVAKLLDDIDRNEVIESLYAKDIYSFDQASQTFSVYNPFSRVIYVQSIKINHTYSTMGKNIPINHCTLKYFSTYIPGNDKEKMRNKLFDAVTDRLKNDPTFGKIKLNGDGIVHNFWDDDTYNPVMPSLPRQNYTQDNSEDKPITLYFNGEPYNHVLHAKENNFTNTPVLSFGQVAIHLSNIDIPSFSSRILDLQNLAGYKLSGSLDINNIILEMHETNNPKNTLTICNPTGFLAYDNVNKYLQILNPLKINITVKLLTILSRLKKGDN